MQMAENTLATFFEAIKTTVFIDLILTVFGILFKF